MESEEDGKRSRRKPSETVIRRRRIRKNTHVQTGRKKTNSSWRPQPWSSTHVPGTTHSTRRPTKWPLRSNSILKPTLGSTEHPSSTLCVKYADQRRPCLKRRGATPKAPVFAHAMVRFQAGATTPPCSLKSAFVACNDSRIALTANRLRRLRRFESHHHLQQLAWTSKGGTQWRSKSCFRSTRHRCEMPDGTTARESWWRSSSSPPVFLQAVDSQRLFSLCRESAEVVHRSGPCPAPHATPYPSPSLPTLPLAPRHLVGPLYRSSRPAHALPRASQGAEALNKDV